MEDRFVAFHIHEIHEDLVIELAIVVKCELEARRASSVYLALVAHLCEVFEGVGFRPCGRQCVGEGAQLIDPEAAM